MTQRFKSIATAFVRGFLGSLLIVLFAPSVARAQDEVVYYHTDAIGSVRMITDASGAEIARYDFLPFGQPWPAPQTPTDVRQFAGKERDPETQLDYFGARYFRADSARFITVDPLMDIEASVGNPQRWNRYSYALNNPLTHQDQDGKFPVPLIIAGVSTFLASPAGQRAMIAGSAYLQRYGAQLQQIALTRGAQISNQVFSLPPLLRGKVIDHLSGTSQKFAHFPVIDDFINGTAISRKSVDVFASSYQRGNALLSKLSGYVDDLASFNGAERGDNIVHNIQQRVLELVVPTGGISNYQRVFQRLLEYADKVGVRVVVKEAGQ